MLPLRITSHFDKPPPHQSNLGPGRLRPTLPQPPTLVAVQGVAPEQNRRVSNRRTTERREKEQALFLDTRTPHGRRRSPGRRAEDQLAPEARRSISIKA